MTNENLDKFIHLEDDAEAGAKRGYVKDKKLAENLANAIEGERQLNESIGLSKRSPEEENRAAETLIAGTIGYKAGKEALIEHYDRDIASRYPGEELSVQSGVEAYESANNARKDAVNRYREFVKETDSAELDRLRRQIREDKEQK